MFDLPRTLKHPRHNPAGWSLQPLTVPPLARLGAGLWVFGLLRFSARHCGRGMTGETAFALVIGFVLFVTIQFVDHFADVWIVGKNVIVN